MARRVIVRKRIENQWTLRRFHDLNGFDSTRANDFRYVLADLVASLQNDLACPITGRRVDNVINCNSSFNFLDAATVSDLGFLGRVKCTKDISIFAESWIHRPQQCHRRKLTALIDPHRKNVFFRAIYFDPTTTFGDHPATWQFTIRRSVRFHDKVNAGRTMKLRNDYTLRSINNEFSTTEHYRDIAEINFFLNRLLFV